MRLSVRLLNASKDALHPIQWSGDASTPLAPVLRRAMLYVPGSNPRMLAKSLDSPADCICYDLEDAVAPSAKPEARRLIADLLNGDRKPKGEVMVRINAVGTGFEAADLDSVLRTKHITALALPKTTVPEHLEWVNKQINALAEERKRTDGDSPIRVVAMIENARGMVGVEEIAKAGRGHLDSLLFAAEDYCADVHLTRTPGRTELLYPRSRLVTAAKAFGLQAIDLVCTQYKSPDVLREESEEGKRLGFDGKQAIHPDQVSTIHAAFAPSPSELERAQRIKRLFEEHDQKGTGAYGDEGEMVDAPVYKQAMNVLAKAKAAGLV